MLAGRDMGHAYVLPHARERTSRLHLLRPHYVRIRGGTGEVVAEAYSPPRVTAAAAEAGLRLGSAFDITGDDEDGNPWDFDIPEQREKAWNILVRDDPHLAIGTPMCTAFSTWQALATAVHGRDPALVARERRRAVMHLEFCMKIYEHLRKYQESC